MCEVELDVGHWNMTGYLDADHRFDRFGAWDALAGGQALGGSGGSVGHGMH